MRRLSLALALALAAALAPQAKAAPITQKLSFTASGFFPTGAPADPLTGSLTFTYDPATPNVVTTTDALALTIGATSYTSASVTADFFAVVGTDCAPGICSILLAVPGFAMSFTDWTTPQIALVNLAYSVGDGTVYFATVFSVQVEPAGVPVQFPAALTGLFLLAIAGLGAQGRAALRARAG